MKTYKSPNHTGTYRRLKVGESIWPTDLFAVKGFERKFWFADKEGLGKVYRRASCYCFRRLPDTTPIRGKAFRN